MNGAPVVATVEVATAHLSGIEAHGGPGPSETPKIWDNTAVGPDPFENDL